MILSYIIDHLVEECISLVFNSFEFWIWLIDKFQPTVWMSEYRRSKKVTEFKNKAILSQFRSTLLYIDSEACV